MQIFQTRRDFIARISAAGATGVLGARASLADEGPPETTTIRLGKLGSLCLAPQYAAEELLRAEGFADVRYVTVGPGLSTSQKIASGEVDFSLNFAAPLVIPIAAGDPITVVAGVHAGCFELFAREGIRRITDLKGKAIGVPSSGSGPHVFVASMLAYVGLDPSQDVRWVTTGSARPKDLFAEGKIDAFLGFPPEPQELRARNIGNVIVNSSVDRPWSQYFCCMLAGNAEFVREHPIATKRLLRAILKVTDLCVAEPERVAQRLVDGGFTEQYDYALQTLTEVPYRTWREYDPADTLRFYALRLHEAGMITASPNQILADRTDWRFLNELKRELKA
ncbi:MAG TPA: ABC transporter substrate-binding protein [Steroidobacteraceae bacterium]|nr:ABC transporter substrate-binding protein [Geminicoccaceae bacterium]HSC07239.1 ABC transporter substrate-binding protein [Steroidobacteraceae bacterium]